MSLGVCTKFLRCAISASAAATFSTVEQVHKFRILSVIFLALKKNSSEKG